jgi:hypothetical protein
LAYWQRWLQSRQKAYEHTLSEDELRNICQKNVLDVIKKLHGQYISIYGKSEQREGVVRHKQLIARLTLEMSVAYSLAETLDFLRRANRLSKLQVACGPIMWEHLQIRDDIEATAQVALSVDPNCVSAKKVLDALQPIELIRAYLSEGLVDEPISMLENELTQKPKNQIAKELLQKAYLEKIKTMMNEPPTETQIIFTRAKKFSLNTSELEVEYAQQVLVKASQAYDIDHLEEADKMLRDGLRVATSNQTLRDKLADVANRRAKLIVEGGIAREPGKILQYIEQGKTILIEVDKVIGPNHPALTGHLNTLREIEATNLNNQGVEYLNSAISYFQSGNRSLGITYLKSSRDALEKAARLQPNNNAVQENLKVARNLLSQAGVY